MLRLRPGRAHTRLWLPRLLRSTAWLRLAVAPPCSALSTASVSAQTAHVVGGSRGASLAHGRHASRAQHASQIISSGTIETGSCAPDVGAECNTHGSLEAQQGGDDNQGSAQPSSAVQLDPGLYLVATPIGKSRSNLSARKCVTRDVTTTAPSVNHTSRPVAA